MFHLENRFGRTLNYPFIHELKPLKFADRVLALHAGNSKAQLEMFNSRGGGARSNSAKD
jgi:hypothetical protein